MHYSSDEMIFQPENPVNVMNDTGYFDVTHSFKVGSSTYHVLGLRQHRPTYGNTYYVFNCGTGEACSARVASAFPPIMHRSLDSAKKSTTTTQKKTITKTTTDPKLIKTTMEEVMKSEHKTLMSSIRDEIHSEKNTLLQSIEKETRIISLKATNTSKSEREEVIRSLKEQITHLESTYETHLRTLVASIETLERKLKSIVETHQDRAPGLDQFQAKFIELFERKISDVTNEHLQTYRSSLIDKKAIEELRSGLIGSRERDVTIIDELNVKNYEAIKSLFTEHSKYVTNLFSQSSKRSSSIDTDALNQLENKLVTTMENLAGEIMSSENRETLVLLFAEQQKYLSETIIKERESFFSSHVFRESIRAILKESIQSTTMVTTETQQETSLSPRATVYDRRPFKISIETAEYANVFAKLFVDGVEYPRDLHTLCQRDPLNVEMVNCFVIPPQSDEPFELTLYAKTHRESEYRAALRIQMPFANIEQPVTFPQLYQAFREHECILVEPLRRALRENEEVMIHMVMPGASGVSLRIGNDILPVDHGEFQNGVLRKMIRVRDLTKISARWNGDVREQDLCLFTMI